MTNKGTNPRALGTNPRALGTNPRKRGRPPIGDKPMTAAERQQKRRDTRLLILTKLQASLTEATKDLNVSPYQDLDLNIKSAQGWLTLIHEDVNDLMKFIS